MRGLQRLTTTAFATVVVLLLAAAPCYHGASLTQRRHLRGQTFKNDEFPLPVQLKLANHWGVQYVAPVSIGGQTLQAVYDTGSFEVMAVSSQCASCKTKMARYDNRSSATFWAGDYPAENHIFAGGEITARQDFETVRIGSPLKVEKMAFWQVLDTDMKVWTQDKASFSAIVGLGHSPVVPMAHDDAQDSLLHRANSQSFSLCLERGPANPGWLTINPSVDTSSANFRAVPVIGKTHWAVQLTGASFEQSAMHCTGPDSCVAIVDSGTSMIGVPPFAIGMVRGIANKVKFDCSNLRELPDLSLELAGQTFVMPPSAYVIRLAGTDEFPDGRCVPAFMDFDLSTDNGAVWILGMPFLRHFYTVFHRTTPATLYIAEQGSKCTPGAGGSGNKSAYLHHHGLADLPDHAQTRPLQQVGVPTIVDPGQAMSPVWASKVVSAGGHRHIDL